jgi:phenylacetate-coenzyme A ligase PaaK-like adenylate-forming protein
MARFSLQSLYDRLPVAAQQMLVSAAGWRSYRARFGPPFRRILQELRQTDRWGPDEIRADQDRRLREMVQWAVATVPYYQRLFRDEGVDPESIRGVEDLPRIPLLEKETVRVRPRELRSEAIPDRQILPGHSSGTTGTALQLFHTREALGWEYAVIWRQRGWFGVRLSDRFAAFGGQTVVPFHQSRPPFWRYDRARLRMLFSIYHLTPEQLSHYVEELRKPGYRFWQGYPSAIALVSQYVNEHGIDLGAAAPRAVFTSSESLLGLHRDQIASATRAPIADRYGHSEFSVSALQCPAGRYHVDTEFCVIEIDPHEETDEWVRGEVVSTGFANRAMPLLRYRTGDVATLRKRGTCPCGRARPILEQIDGRIEDYVVTPDGRRIGRMDHVFKDALEVKEAQIHQPSLERIVVRLVPRAGFDDEARGALEREFRLRVGEEIKIEYEILDQIPRLPNGKFRAVTSDLDAGRMPHALRVRPPRAGDFS